MPPDPVPHRAPPTRFPLRGRPDKKDKNPLRHTDKIDCLQTLSAASQRPSTTGAPSIIPVRKGGGGGRKREPWRFYIFDFFGLP